MPCDLGGYEMCGIYGEFQFHGSIDTLGAIDRLQLLSHRGPDGWGIALGNTHSRRLEVRHNPAGQVDAEDTNLLFGHRRLAVIDLSERALQPMQSPDGALVMVFNGEIYNFVELRERLSLLGHAFATDHSDSEVLLHAYQEWGEACLEELHGMFAFGIYDRTRGKIFLARDRAGQKPLYYVLDNERFAFSSELTPLTRFGEEKVKIDPTSLAQYLMLGYVPDPRSIFSGIHKLPAAHAASLDLATHQIETRCYWEPPFETDSDLDYGQAEELTKEYFERAVRRRLIADVPIGAFISGGIDSTLVAKMVVENDAPLDAAMSADFSDESMSERIWVDQVAERYGLNMSHVYLDNETAEIHEEVLSRLDEPFDGGSAIPSHELYGIADGKVTVVLTGDGGDELFGGYGRYVRFLRTERLLGILRSLRIALPLLRLALPFLRRSRQYWYARAFASGDDLRTYAARISKPWMTGIMRHPPTSVDLLYDYVDRLRDKIEDLGVKAAQYIDFRTALPGRMLYKADRLSMSRGLEVRSPFMDHELIELAFRIPSHIHFKEPDGKSLLRSLVARDMGREFVDRPKHGFGNPLSSWFASKQGKPLLSELADEGNLIYRFLDYSKTLRCFPEIREGFSGRNVQELWRLVVLSRYIRRHREKIVFP
jgi:asparagine synthase (glutamine-hydrolysing)